MIGQMQTTKRWLPSLWWNKKGQNIIEYAVLGATLVVVLAGFLPQSLMSPVGALVAKISKLF